MCFFLSSLNLIYASSLPSILPAFSFASNLFHAFSSFSILLPFLYPYIKMYFSIFLSFPFIHFYPFISSLSFSHLVLISRFRFSTFLCPSIPDGFTSLIHTFTFLSSIFALPGLYFHFTLHRLSSTLLLHANRISSAS